MPLQIHTFYPWLDLAGLSVFAATGALLAARLRLDLIGACFFALVLTRLELAAPWPALLAFVLGFLLRGAAIRWKLTLPAHRGQRTDWTRFRGKRPLAARSGRSEVRRMTGQPWDATPMMQTTELFLGR